MSRRNAAEKRDILPDPKYGSKVVAKLINQVMQSGKKALAQSIVYEAFEIAAANYYGTWEKTNNNVIIKFSKVQRFLLFPKKIQRKNVNDMIYLQNICFVFKIRLILQLD